MTPKLPGLWSEAWRYQGAIRRCPFLLQHQKKRPSVSAVRGAIERGRADAGLDDVIFHDSRRSAVRRIKKAGIDNKDGMQITGHLTEQAYKRYDIDVEDDAIDTGRKLRKYELTQQELCE